MLKNKWILLLGSTGGIGKEAANYLYNQGYNLVLLGRNKERIENIFSALSEERRIIYETDILDENKVKLSLDEINSKLGKLDGFVNCAGYQVMSGVSLIKLNDIREMFEVNVFSPFILLKYFSKKKYFNKGASCVLLSSVAAHEGAIGNAFYASTKGALEGMLKSVAAEFSNRRRINLVSPGIIKVGMGNKLVDNLSSEQIKKLENSYPLGLGEGVDIAYMIEYLISEKAKWITGQNFILDGGCLST